MNQLLRKALKQTVPVMVGYLVLGAAFGLLLYKAGYSYLWALLISLLVYAGSMQFVLISFLQGPIGLLSIIITTFSVNSRHIFYGISFIEKFKKMGKRRLYMIFSLTDETYSLLCSTKSEDSQEESNLIFLMSLLNQSYWIIGSFLGNLLGSIITFDTSGVEFSMTALFVVILVEQWLTTKNHLPAFIGIFCGVISLLFFGADEFLLPALITAVVILMALQNKIQVQTDLKTELQMEQKRE